MTQISASPQGNKRPAQLDTIRPFQVKVPEAELTELRRRINATRWPEGETAGDHSGTRALLGDSV
jgi:hypothetical protein